jgi:hypothetical protein
MSNIDLDNDGVIEEDEVDIMKRRLALQRRIATFAFIALLVSGGWLMFGMEETRLQAMGNLLDLYFITLGGIIATYMGSEAYATANR